MVTSLIVALVFLAIVIICLGFVLFELYAEIEYFKKERDDLTRQLWTKNEDLSQLRQKHEALLERVGQRTFRLDTAAFKHGVEKAEAAATQALEKAFPPDIEKAGGPLLDLSPGVDTAAQLPIPDATTLPLCKHCGRREDNHDLYSSPRQCIPTLLPDGTLEERQTHFEAAPPLPPPPLTQPSLCR